MWIPSVGGGGEGEGELPLILPKNHSSSPGEQDGADGEGAHDSRGLFCSCCSCSSVPGALGADSRATATPRAPHAIPFSLWETCRGYRHPPPPPQPAEGCSAGLGVGGGPLSIDLAVMSCLTARWWGDEGAFSAWGDDRRHFLDLARHEAGDACGAARGSQRWQAPCTPQQAFWPPAAPALAWALLFREWKAREARGRGRITPTSHPSFRQAVSTQHASPGAPGMGAAPASPVGHAQPRADLQSRDGAIQHPAPSPLALPLPWPVAQSMVLVKMRKYLYKNNLKNMVCQIIKAAEHPRSFQLDWEIRCCFPTPHCDAGGARSWPCGLLDLPVQV